jgi:hypothetical protein
MKSTPCLSSREMEVELRNFPGLIPIALDVPGGRVEWLDLDGYHCYEAFFHQSIAAYISMRKTPPRSFFTELDALCNLEPGDRIEPSGLIFHAGRCGSTLLAKVLARSRAHMVFSEARPHNQIWKALEARGNAETRLYRRLVLAMGRRRLRSHTAHIIKFTSFNIAAFDFIRAAFPGVPALFLFRDPGEVAASYARNPPGWIGGDLGVRVDGDQPADLISTFFRIAEGIKDPDFRCLDLAHLKPALIPEILRYFRLGEPPDISLMFSEFAHDAKSPQPGKFFSGMERKNAIPVPDSLRSLYARLCTRASEQWGPLVDQT